MERTTDSCSTAAASPAAVRGRRGPQRNWWEIAPAEARAHATLLALVLWAIAAVVAFAGSGYRSVFGPLKGSDFIQFYTLGHLDAQTAPATLYDPEAFHRLQARLVPESDSEHYLIVYPPHVTLLFRPFAGLSYGTAALLWASMLIAAYAACLWLAWRPLRRTGAETRLLIAAAAAFPPFWYLVLHGQTTVVPLAAFTLGWFAIEHGRPFWAGMAFGLLLLKPQFALVIAPLVLICRQWSMLAGGVVCVGLHVLATVWLLGDAPLWNYAGVVARFPQLQDDLSPRPEQMHSISSLTRALPAGWDTLAWALCAVLIIAATVRVWRASAPAAVKSGALVLASVLVNPHVFVYDATVLAPAALWFAGWIYGGASSSPAARSWFVWSLYALYLTFLAPTAAFLPVQASVVVMAALFALIVRTAAAPGSDAPPELVQKSGQDQPFSPPRT